MTEKRFKEIHIFSDDLYRYLFRRRINIEHCRPALRNRDDPPSKFHPNIGMSVLWESFRSQKNFISTFFDNNLQFHTDSQDFEKFSHFIAFYSSILHSENRDNIFKVLIMIASMILELCTFYHLRKNKLMKYYAASVFTLAFEEFIRKEFFEKGGWNALMRFAADDAKLYSEWNLEIRLSNKEVEFRTEWLRKHDLCIATYGLKLMQVHNILSESVDQECSASGKKFYTGKSHQKKEKTLTADGKTPVARDKAPVMENEICVATHEGPFAATEGSIAINVVPVATDRGPVLINEIYFAQDQSPAINETRPTVDDEVIATDDEALSEDDIAENAEVLVCDSLAANDEVLAVNEDGEALTGDDESLTADDDTSHDLVADDEVLAVDDDEVLLVEDKTGDEVFTVDDEALAVDLSVDEEMLAVDDFAADDESVDDFTDAVDDFTADDLDVDDEVLSVDDETDDEVLTADDVALAEDDFAVDDEVQAVGELAENEEGDDDSLSAGDLAVDDEALSAGNLAVDCETDDEAVSAGDLTVDDEADEEAVSANDLAADDHVHGGNILTADDEEDNEALAADHEVVDGEDPDAVDYITRLNEEMSFLKDKCCDFTDKTHVTDNCTPSKDETATKKDKPSLAIDKISIVNYETPASVAIDISPLKDEIPFVKDKIHFAKGKCSHVKDGTTATNDCTSVGSTAARKEESPISIANIPIGNYAAPYAICEIAAVTRDISNMSDKTPTAEEEISHSNSETFVETDEVPASRDKSGDENDKISAENDFIPSRAKKEIPVSKCKTLAAKDELSIATEKIPVVKYRTFVVKNENAAANCDSIAVRVETPVEKYEAFTTIEKAPIFKEHAQISYDEISVLREKISDVKYEGFTSIDEALIQENDQIANVEIPVVRDKNTVTKDKIFTAVDEIRYTKHETTVETVQIPTVKGELRVSFAKEETPVFKEHEIVSGKTISDKLHESQKSFFEKAIFHINENYSSSDKSITLKNYKGTNNKSMSCSSSNQDIFIPGRILGDRKSKSDAGNLFTYTKLSSKVKSNSKNKYIITYPSQLLIFRTNNVKSISGVISTVNTTSSRETITGFRPAVEYATSKNKLAPENRKNVTFEKEDISKKGNTSQKEKEPSQKKDPKSNPEFEINSVSAEMREQFHLQDFIHKIENNKDSAGKQLLTILNSAKVDKLLKSMSFRDLVLEITKNSESKIQNIDVLQLANLVLRDNETMAAECLYVIQYMDKLSVKENLILGRKSLIHHDTVAKRQDTDFKYISPYTAHQKLLKDFTLVIFQTYDSFGSELCKIFNSKENADILLSDRVFTKIMHLSVTNLENRLENEWILSVAKSLISYSKTSSSHSPLTASSSYQNAKNVSTHQNAATIDLAKPTTLSSRKTKCLPSASKTGKSDIEEAAFYLLCSICSKPIDESGTCDQIECNRLHQNKLIRCGATADSSEYTKRQSMFRNTENDSKDAEDMNEKYGKMDEIYGRFLKYIKERTSGCLGNPTEYFCADVNERTKIEVENQTPNVSPQKSNNIDKNIQSSIKEPNKNSRKKKGRKQRKNKNKQRSELPHPKTATDIPVAAEKRNTKSLDMSPEVSNVSSLSTDQHNFLIRDFTNFLTTEIKKNTWITVILPQHKNSYTKNVLKLEDTLEIIYLKNASETTRNQSDVSNVNEQVSNIRKSGTPVVSQNAHEIKEKMFSIFQGLYYVNNSENQASHLTQRQSSDKISDHESLTFMKKLLKETDCNKNEEKFAMISPSHTNDETKKKSGGKTNTEISNGSKFSTTISEPKLSPNSSNIPIRQTKSAAINNLGSSKEIKLSTTIAQPKLSQNSSSIPIIPTKSLKTNTLNSTKERKFSKAIPQADPSLETVNIPTLPSISPETTNLCTSTDCQDQTSASEPKLTENALNITLKERPKTYPEETINGDHQKCKYISETCIKNNFGENLEREALNDETDPSDMCITTEIETQKREESVKFQDHCMTNTSTLNSNKMFEENCNSASNHPSTNHASVVDEQLVTQEKESFNFPPLMCEESETLIHNLKNQNSLDIQNFSRKISTIPVLHTLKDALENFEISFSPQSTLFKRKNQIKEQESNISCDKLSLCSASELNLQNMIDENKIKVQNHTFAFESRENFSPNSKIIFEDKGTNGKNESSNVASVVINSVTETSAIIKYKKNTLQNQHLSDSAKRTFDNPQTPSLSMNQNQKPKIIFEGKRCIINPSMNPNSATGSKNAIDVNSIKAQTSFDFEPRTTHSESSKNTEYHSRSTVCHMKEVSVTNSIEEVSSEEKETPLIKLALSHTVETDQEVTYDNSTENQNIFGTNVCVDSSESRPMGSVSFAYLSNETHFEKHSTKQKSELSRLKLSKPCALEIRTDNVNDIMVPKNFPVSTNGTQNSEFRFEKFKENNDVSYPFSQIDASKTIMNGKIINQKLESLSVKNEKTLVNVTNIVGMKSGTDTEIPNNCNTMATASVVHSDCTTQNLLSPAVIPELQDTETCSPQQENLSTEILAAYKNALKLLPEISSEITDWIFKEISRKDPDLLELMRAKFIIDKKVEKEFLKHYDKLREICEENETICEQSDLPRENLGNQGAESSIAKEF